MEATQYPFGYAIGSVNGGCIGGFEEVLGDDVKGAFGSVAEVSQRVFGRGEASCKADCEQGRVVVDDIGVGVGG